MSRVHLTAVLSETVDAVAEGANTRRAIQARFGLGQTAAWDRLRRGVEAGLLVESREPGARKPVVYSLAGKRRPNDWSLSDDDTAALFAIKEGIVTMAGLRIEYPGSSDDDLRRSVAKLLRIKLLSVRCTRYHLTPAGRIVVELLSRRTA